MDLRIRECRIVTEGTKTTESGLLKHVGRECWNELIGEHLKEPFNGNIMSEHHQSCTISERMVASHVSTIYYRTVTKKKKRVKKNWRTLDNCDSCILINKFSYNSWRNSSSLLLGTSNLLAIFYNDWTD